MSSAERVWIASYPKSGNTWVRVFLSSLLNNTDGAPDINALCCGRIASALSWIEETAGFAAGDLSPAEIDALRPRIYDWTAERPGFHKIHDAYRRLPCGAPLTGSQPARAAIYLIRNPLDVAVSLAFHSQCSIDAAIALLNDPHHATPRRRPHASGQARQVLLDWSGHVESWIDTPGGPRLAVRYEDLLARPVRSFTRIARFVQIDADGGRIRQAVAQCAFDRLQSQETANGFREKPPGAERFFRCGRAGVWRKVMTPGQTRRIVERHGAVMRRFGYLDDQDQPV